MTDLGLRLFSDLFVHVIDAGSMDKVYQEQRKAIDQTGFPINPRLIHLVEYATTVLMEMREESDKADDLPYPWKNQWHRRALRSRVGVAVP